MQLTLPLGNYRFRADLTGTQFWSGTTDHCSLPGCLTATVVVPLPVTVTVSDTDAVPQEGLPVYVFDGAAYTGYNGVTDAAGGVVFTLPQGDYRFRADRNGTQFWSGETDHCAIPGCTETSVTVTIPVTVTVQSETGSAYPDLPVYAFNGESYTGFHGTSDADGQVVFTLPEGDYRFRADYDGVQFWSGLVNHCTIPGCLDALVEIPGGVGGPVSVTIDYAYDPLQRLVAADYSTGEFFHYSYDAVGNRLTQDTLTGTNTYVYDIANRLEEVDGFSYIWDDNGNLHDDGVREYSYDHANRLTTVEIDYDDYEFAYNGLGDRLRQAVNGVPIDYTLDLAAGLTQVLSNGDNAYLYGVGRIGEQQPEGWQYHLGDALGSVRQFAESSAAVALAQAFQPFGTRLSMSAPLNSIYGFAGEQRDGTGLVYLRARHYDPVVGRFATADAWAGNPHTPITLNRFIYGGANPIMNVDPSGRWICTVASLLANPSCVEWTEDALSKLESSGAIGRSLLGFFHQHDQGLKLLSSGSCLQPLLAGLLGGVQIVFLPLSGRANAITLSPAAIIINSNVYNGASAKPEGVATFGHEISHLEQALKSLSVQGEILSAVLTYQLETELRRPFHHPEGTYVVAEELDPWDDSDLSTFRNHPNWGVPWPLRPLFGDLPRDWLGQWKTRFPYSVPSITPTSTPSPPHRPQPEPAPRP